MNLLNRSQVVPSVPGVGSVGFADVARPGLTTERTDVDACIHHRVGGGHRCRNRVVTLKGPKGNVVDVAVDPSDKRFDTLKVGDQVKATYYESLAMRVRKPGDSAPTAGVTDSVTPSKDASWKDDCSTGDDDGDDHGDRSVRALRDREECQRQRLELPRPGSQAPRGGQGRRHRRCDLHAGDPRVGRARREVK